MVTKTEHVRELALALFDCTKNFHGLGEAHRRLLGWAAFLLCQPEVLGDRKSRKQIKRKAQSAEFASQMQRLVQSQGEQQFSQQEQATLAAIISLQHGKVKARQVILPDIPPDQQRDVYTLAGLLGIAAGLDYSNSQQTLIRRVEPGPGGIWILVEGMQALADAAAAQQNARIWLKSGYPKIRVLEAKQAEEEILQWPSLPKPMKTMGIGPAEAMAEAGRKVLRYHFAEMLRHEEGTRLGEDIEALHDMRVATRRMRAAFEVFGEAFESEAIRPHLKGLRATGRALGRVRDLDVFMQKARNYLEALPEASRDGLAPLLLGWQVQRESARAEMLAHLSSESHHTFKWEFNNFLSTPGAGARTSTPDVPVPFLVKEVAPVLIYTRLAGVRAYDRILENASLVQYHALRIEFKKLRYTLEFFREVLGEEAKGVINAIKKLQDHLGDLNDADVATRIIREFLDQWEPMQSGVPVGERKSPEAIFSYLAFRHAETHQLMNGFGEAWEGFNQADFRRSLAMAVSVL